VLNYWLWDSRKD